MQAIQLRLLQALRRAIGWCLAHPEVVRPAEGPSDTWTPLTRQAVMLASIVATVQQAATQQGVTAKERTLAATDEPGLRNTLRAKLHSVTQVAQALRKQVPGINTLKMPSTNLQTEGFLKAAAALITRAATYETTLVEHGLAADFIAQLQSAVAALQASVDSRGSARGRQVVATKQVAATLALGKQYVHLMDVGISEALHNDPVKLAGWKHAKRVTLTAGSSPTLDAGIGSADVATPVTAAQPGIMTTTPQAEAQAA